jgi:hypothetical protein
MLEEAWKLYRGWAARARQQQATTQMWNRIALFMVVLTAFLGTFSSQFDKDSKVVFWIAMTSAVIAAVSGWLGREALAVESETKWVKARGFAESLKSECFRFAGGVGAYAGGGADASKAFRDRFRALRAEVNDLDIAPGDPTPPAGGSEPPQAGMAKDWYVEKRLGDQRRYFQKTLDRSARKIFWYRIIALASMVLAAMCSAAVGLTDLPIGPWTGVITTISAAFVAAGMNERAQAISASAARMINQIDDIMIERELLTLTELVERTEDALLAENLQWRETMQKTRAAAVAAAAQRDGQGAAPAGPPAHAPADEPVDGPPVDGPAEERPVEDPAVEAPPADEPADESNGNEEPGEETPRPAGG